VLRELARSKSPPSPAEIELAVDRMADQALAAGDTRGAHNLQAWRIGV
jgi:hypothetical protein